MDFLAGIALLVGLGAAIAVWQATKRRAQRNATESELAHGFDVHLGPN